MNRSDYRLRVLKRAGLTEKDARAVADAVACAEKNTSGEIVAAVTPASHTYSFQELLFALCCSAGVFAVFMYFLPDFYTLVSYFFWGDAPVWIAPFSAGALIFICTSLVFLCANIPAVDRLIVPAAYRNEAVFRRALRFFAESGVYDTKEHSGILIFISLLEKKVCIIADRGISERIDRQVWDDIAARLSAGFAKSRTRKRAGGASADKGSSVISVHNDLSAPALALIEAVEECGRLLAQHFPPDADNPDELHNALTVLEGGE